MGLGHLSIEEQLKLSRQVNEDLIRLLASVLIEHHQQAVIVTPDILRNLSRVETEKIGIEIHNLPDGQTRISVKEVPLEVRHDR